MVSNEKMNQKTRIQNTVRSGQTREYKKKQTKNNMTRIEIIESTKSEHRI